MPEQPGKSLPLSLPAEVVTGAMRLPEFPNRDPAEELTVATARVHKLILPTTDTGLNGCRHVRIRHFAPVLEKTPPR